jgi:hypothetical protein
MRAASEARAGDRARHGVSAPRCTANAVGDGGPFAPVPRQAMSGTEMFLAGVEAHIAQDRWPQQEAPSSE